MLTSVKLRGGHLMLSLYPPFLHHKNSFHQQGTMSLRDLPEQAVVNFTLLLFMTFLILLTFYLMTHSTSMTLSYK
jgi:hypothetical protein